MRPGRCTAGAGRRAPAPPEATTTPDPAPARSVIQLAGAHQGQRFLVVGSGPSAADFDYGCLGQVVKLGANGIGYLLQPDYYCIVDPRAYALFRDVFDRASAVRLLASWLPVAPCDYVIPLARHRESGFDRGVFYHGRNVGYVLLQLAYFLGASEIHLIGIDGYSPARANYFQRFPQWYADRSAALWTQRFAELTTSCFAAAAAALNAEGIEIINHSPASFLRTLPGVSTRAAR